MTRRTCSALIQILVSIALSASALAAYQYIDFAPDFKRRQHIASFNPSDNPRELAFALTKNIPVKEAYVDARAMATIGGILFAGVARPSDQLTNKCPTLSIDLSQPNGNRLAARFSDKKEVHGKIFDWELLPTVKYVISGDQGLFTYMRDYAQYQSAFSNNLAGLTLFLLDGSRDLADFPSAHLFLAGLPIPGYPQVKPTEENYAAWFRLRDWLGYEQLMFFDRDVDFVFSTDGSRLIISGLPYWVAVQKNVDDQDGHVLRSFTDTATARLTNPTIYDSIYRISQFSAFFRYMKVSCDTEWSKFLDNFNRKQATMIDMIVPDGQMFGRYTH